MHIGLGIFLLRGVIRKGGERVLYELFWNGQKGVNFTENINLKKILKFCWHLNSYAKNIDKPFIFLIIQLQLLFYGSLKSPKTS